MPGNKIVALFAFDADTTQFEIRHTSALMQSEYYHLRRTAIKDLAAYCGFLLGFLGSAPLAWELLASQLFALWNSVLQLLPLIAKKLAAHMRKE